MARRMYSGSAHNGGCCRPSSCPTAGRLQYGIPVVRVKDITGQGVRDNQIYGLGGGGPAGYRRCSGARANVQMIANMLEGFGITVSASDLGCGTSRR